MSEVKNTQFNDKEVIPDYRSYMGNINLKRSGVKVEWTQELIEEYLRCSQDVVYFVENYIKIINVDKGLIPFKVHDYQREMLIAMKEERQCIFTTARQSGKCVVADTAVEVKFLDSRSQTLKISTVHEIAKSIAKCKSLYSHEAVGQLVYQDLLLFDEEEAEKFSTMWRTASHKGDIFEQGAQRESECRPSGENSLAGDKRAYEASSNEEMSAGKKFLETLELTGFSVLTDNGFKPLCQSHLTVKYREWNLRTQFHELTCADHHLVFDQHYNEVRVEDLKVGDKIWTDTGLQTVESVEATDQFSHMYDLGVDDVDHRYYTNGILSHNSTTTCAFILWYVLFNPEKTVAILANKGDTAREILGKIALAYQHLPKWLQQGVKEWAKGTMVLENNSRIIAAATSSNNIRGFTINLLFIDEAAFIDNWDEFFTSVFPTISSGKTTKIVLVSTPNGLNHFHSTWERAKRGENGYYPIEVVWEKVPGRDEEWKQNTLMQMNFDYEKFSQEYECVFGKEMVTVRNKNGQIYTMPIEDLFFFMKRPST